MPLNPVVVKPVTGLAVVANTPQAVWTPATGKKFRLMGYHLGVAVAAASVILKDNGTEVVRSGFLAIGQTDACDLLASVGIPSAAANNPLQVDVSANATVHGFVWGFEE